MVGCCLVYGCVLGGIYFEDVGGMWYLALGLYFEFELDSGTKVDRVWLRVVSSIGSWR